MAEDDAATKSTFGLILFVLLIAGGLVRNAVLERREKQIEQMLCDITTRVLGH